ncbi:MAG: hypothetical protein V4857_01405 [Pseudomonadota bacterium]
MTKIGRLTSGLTLLIGVTVLCGWWLQLEAVVRLSANTVAMVPNTAVCCILGALALAVCSRPTIKAQRFKYLFAFLIAVLAGLVLLQHIFDVSFGVDTLLSRIWLNDSNPHPGRMAPQTCTSFLTIALIVSLFNTRLTPAKDALIQACLVLLGAVGAIGVAGYVFQLSVLYSWYQHTAIAVLTATAIVLLTVGLWCEWIHWRRRPDSGLGAAAGGPRLAASTPILAAILVAGLSGFVVSFYQAEQMMHKHLSGILAMQVRSIDAEIDGANEITDAIGSRPFMIRQLDAINRGEPSPEAVRDVEQVVKSFVTNNISALAIHSLNGKQVATLGNFAPATEFDLMLDHTRRLLWDKHFILRRSVGIMRDGQLVGTALVEIRLPKLAAMLTDAQSLGRSAESILCTPAAADLIRCSPTRHHARVFTMERMRHGQPRPISLAIDGAKGTTVTRDYRNEEVLAAYNVVGHYPLGVVSKIDTVELYAPLRRLFQLALACLGAFILAAALAMRFPARAARAGAGQAA